MDIKERNEQIKKLYAEGMTLVQLSEKFGVSITQLSRIMGGKVKRVTKLQKDIELYKQHEGKSHREISDITGLTVSRIRHLIKYSKYGNVKHNLDFTDCKPEVDPSLINDCKWLKRQYTIEKKGAPTIAKMLGVHCRDVYGALKNCKIDRRKMDEATELLATRISKEWLEKHYVGMKWSVARCAEVTGHSWDTIFKILRKFGFGVRDCSSQQVGVLNGFYGRCHDERTRVLAAEVGARCGREYWLVGDVEAKKEAVRVWARGFWTAERRSVQSARIAALCRVGGCNSRRVVYGGLLLRSSWEERVARFLDGCEGVVDWRYEEVVVPYLVDGVFKNFVVDFWVELVGGRVGLLEVKNDFLRAREGAKLGALAEFCRVRGWGCWVVGASDLDELGGVLGLGG